VGVITYKSDTKTLIVWNRNNGWTIRCWLWRKLQPQTRVF